MLPHDLIAVIVKVMFVLSAAFMLCLSKVRAEDNINFYNFDSISQVKSLK